MSVNLIFDSVFEIHPLQNFVPAVFAVVLLLLLQTRQFVKKKGRKEGRKEGKKERKKERMKDKIGLKKGKIGK